MSIVMAAEDQAGFAAALLDAAHPLPPGLIAWNGSDPARRFAVYRNNVMVGLIDALSSSFPVTLALVGDEFFRAMAREFVVAWPPRSRLLVEHADALPDFIAGFAPAAGLPYLAEVARIEALRVRAYHAADAAPVDAEAFRPLLAAPERLATTRIGLHPACHWLRTRYAAWSVWAAHQLTADLAGGHVDTVDLHGIDVDSSEEVLIARPDLEVRTLALPVGGADFLDALAAGRPLIDAVTAASGRDGFDPAAHLALLIQHGLAVRLESAAELSQ